MFTYFKRPKRRLIGLYGYSGVGKDTVAKLFQNQTLESAIIKGTNLRMHEIFEGKRLEMLNSSYWKTEKFARIPKLVTAKILGIPVEKLEDKEYRFTYIPEYQKRVFELMIDIPEAIKKVTSDEVWVNTVFNEIKDDDCVIFTDLRFPSEYERLKKENAILIHIQSDDVPKRLEIDGLLDGYKFDWIIYNDFNNYRKMIAQVRNICYREKLYLRKVYTFYKARENKIKGYNVENQLETKDQI